jgi:hypothetical protein
MTREELIAFALNLPEATESAHFERRAFRVRGRIFMTLPGGDYCVVRLKPDQQKMAIAIAPDVTVVVPGGWGERGATRLYHAAADDRTVHDLVQQAWKNAAPKSLISKEE